MMYYTVNVAVTRATPCHTLALPQVPSTAHCVLRVPIGLGCVRSVNQREERRRRLGIKIRPKIRPKTARPPSSDRPSGCLSDHPPDCPTGNPVLETFSPSAWNGLKVPPIDFETAPGMFTSIPVRSRPIRQELYVHAKKEFERLVQYFYDPKSSSATASPLAIAPKAMSPYTRFCGDYLETNQYITIPKYPIPIVQHELIEASQYKVYVDLDVARL